MKLDLFMFMSHTFEMCVTPAQRYNNKGLVTCLNGATWSSTQRRAALRMSNVNGLGYHWFAFETFLSGETLLTHKTNSKEQASSLQQVRKGAHSRLVFTLRSSGRMKERLRLQRVADWVLGLTSVAAACSSPASHPTFATQKTLHSASCRRLEMKRRAMSLVRKVYSDAHQYTNASV